MKIQTPLRLFLLFAFVIASCTPVVAATGSLNGVTVASSVPAAPLANKLFHAGAVEVLTQHNDNQGTGANLEETSLTPSNVNSSTFGLLYSRPVSGHVYAQPLVASQVTMPQVGDARNVVYVATMGNNVYAFDADDPARTAPFWTRQLGNPIYLPDLQTAFTTTTTQIKGLGAACGTYNDIRDQVGIISTPVIDDATNTMYLVAVNKSLLPQANGYFTYTHYLHALDITTGAERAGSPVAITGNVSGTNGSITFFSEDQIQRASLTLANGKVYIAFAGYCDTYPYNGWIFGYNKTTLNRDAINSVARRQQGDGSGIWMAGQKLTVDAQGNLYLMTGNGQTGTSNYTNSFVKLDPNLQIVDYFTPCNTNFLNSVDWDLGSAGPMIIPNSRLVVGGGKEGRVYLLDQQNMGGYNNCSTGGSNPITRTDAVVQSYQTVGEGTAGIIGSNVHVHGSPIWYEGLDGQGVARKYMYVWGESDVLRGNEFIVNGTLPGGLITGTFNVTSTLRGNIKLPNYKMPGGMLSLSANGQTNGIIWAAHPTNGNANQAVVSGTMRAFSAMTLQELWNTDMLPNRDLLGKFAKFVPPTIVNGKVYVPTFDEPSIPVTGAKSAYLRVYGLLYDLNATAGSSQTAVVNTEFNNVVQATLTSGGVYNLQGVSVTFTLPGSGASGTFAGGGTVFTGTTDVNGNTTTPLITANGVAGSYVVTATSTGMKQAAAFSLTNVACGNGLTVYSLLDGNQCGTLRYAITSGNLAIGSGNVVINIASTLVVPTSTLPVISNGSANSYTISGIAGTPVNGRAVPGTRISGSSAGANVNGLTLNGKVKIENLHLTGFGGDGIMVNGNNNQLNALWVGRTDSGEPASYANGGNGIQISGDGNQLGVAGDSTTGVLIGANGGVGLRLTGTGRTSSYHTWVGYNRDGTISQKNNGGALKIVPDAALEALPGSRNRFRG